MKWAHLPVAGGLYDQHPDLMNAFKLIFAMKADHERSEQDKREREQKRMSSRGGVAGRRR